MPVIDGAGAHTSGALSIPENVLLVPLPPYCPELNPIERRRLVLKHRMGRALQANLAAQKACAARILCDYSLAALASLCAFASAFAPTV